MSDLLPAKSDGGQKANAVAARDDPGASGAPSNVNVKVYDRPERTGPSLLMVLVPVVVLIVLAILIYRMVQH